MADAAGHEARWRLRGGRVRLQAAGLHRGAVATLFATSALLAATAGLASLAELRPNASPPALAIAVGGGDLLLAPDDAGTTAVFAGDRRLGVIHGHAAPIVSAVLAADGDALMTLDAHGQLRRTDLATLQAASAADPTPLAAALVTGLWDPYGAPVARAVAGLPWRPAETGSMAALASALLALGVLAGPTALALARYLLPKLRQAQPPNASAAPSAFQPPRAPADVFVSYRREDLAAVRRIVEGLRGVGLSVWWDQDIAPDAPWETTMERELKAAKVVIVAWSPAAVESENVKSEARFARTQGKLIQVFVEPCAPPIFFGERQGVDLSDWTGAGNDHRFKTLIDAARAMIAGERPLIGVGYAPKRRNYWDAIAITGVVLSAGFALGANLGGARDAVCSFAPLAVPCADWGLITIAAPAPPDPAASVAAERAQLLSQLNGRWARGDVDPVTGNPRDCTRNVLTIEVITDAAGGARLHLRAEGFESRDQVETAADGIVRVSGRDSNGVLVEGRYEPAGDRLTYTSGGTETLMHRCQ